MVTESSKGQEIKDGFRNHNLASEDGHLRGKGESDIPGSSMEECSVEARQQGGRGTAADVSAGGRHDGHKEGAAATATARGHQSLHKFRRPSPLRSVSPTPDQNNDGSLMLMHLSDAAELASAASPLARLSPVGGIVRSGGSKAASGLPPRPSGKKLAAAQKHPHHQSRPPHGSTSLSLTEAAAARYGRGEGIPQPLPRPDLAAVVEHQTSLLGRMLQLARQQQHDMER